MDLTIPLVLQNKTPIYLQIYEYMKREISQGSLRAGTRLPSHRNLAMQLNVSRITVESAYQQLLAEGYVESKPKRGIFVAEVDIDVIQKKQQIASNIANNKESEQYDYDCSQGLIDQKSFPITNWKRALHETLFQYEDELFAKEDP
ncbi:GntR family transcriptional regulator, partial [Bacillus anthracis]